MMNNMVILTTLIFPNQRRNKFSNQKRAVKCRCKFSHGAHISAGTEEYGLTSNLSQFSEQSSVKVVQTLSRFD